MSKKYNFTISRKDFLKQGVSLGAALAVPGFLLSACSGPVTGDDPGGSSSGSHYALFELTFSKQMDKASVESALSVSPNDASFSGKTFEWSSGDTIFYCKLPCNSAGTPYTVTIAATAVDTAGNAIDGNSNGTGGDPYTLNITSV